MVMLGSNFLGEMDGGMLSQKKQLLGTVRIAALAPMGRPFMELWMDSFKNQLKHPQCSLFFSSFGDCSSVFFVVLTEEL